MKNSICIFTLPILLASCDSIKKKPVEELIKLLENQPDIEYLETNISILKVNKTYYCDLVETQIECLTTEQVKKEFGCTKDELDKMFKLVKQSGAFAVEKNEKGQVLFTKGDFMNNFSGFMYSPAEIDLTKLESYFVTFYITNIEKENDSWYRVE